jgi:polysaccharide export outer membrane protein
MKFYGLTATALALVVGGCAAADVPKVGSSGEVTVLAANELPAPPSLRRDGAFELGPLDKVQVQVVGIEQLNQTFQIDASGRITFPYAGSLQAAGLTPMELAEALKAALRASYVRNPLVSVNLEETVSRVVTVDGEVQLPGEYPIAGNTTLMRAVAKARGLTENAQLRHVTVFREVDGTSMAALYDLRAIRSGVYRDPPVYSGDLVVVGTSQARRLFGTILQSSGILMAPIIALLQRP